MNREYKSTSKLVRSILAGAAALCTVLVVSAVAGLAEHYHGAAELARTLSPVVAQR